jgi:hypothetical protein
MDWAKFVGRLPAKCAKDAATVVVICHLLRLVMVSINSQRAAGPCLAWTVERNAWNFLQADALQVMDGWTNANGQRSARHHQPCRCDIGLQQVHSSHCHDSFHLQ